MAIKQTLEDSKARLDALLEFANNATGESDANIGDAIKTLVDGFGQGGSGSGGSVGKISFIPAVSVGDVVPNKYLASGNETTYNNWSISPYYYVDRKYKYIIIDNALASPSTRNQYSAAYDEDFNKISAPAITNAGSYAINSMISVGDINANAQYIRISGGTSEINSLKVYYLDVEGSGGGSGGTQLPGKTVVIDGACEIYVGDLGDYGYGVRIDQDVTDGNPVMCSWNPASCDSIFYLRSNNNPSTNTYHSYWGYDATTHTFKYNGSTINSWNMRGTWQFIPYTV